FLVYGNLAHVETLRFRRKFRFHQLSHEIDAQNWADNSEGVRNRISDRRILVVHHLKCGLERGGARHRSGVYAHRMTGLHAIQPTKPKPYKMPRAPAPHRKQIVGAADALHALEELPPIKNPDAVEEHEQARQPDRPDDLCLGGKCADSESDEQHGADAKRKSTDADLADQVTQPDGQKRGQDWLRPDDLAG